jgi:hypothetical protein
MSDQTSRPSWPTGQPEPEPEPVRPGWERLPSAARRAVDLKLVIAVLIGLVSVTGAVVAWQSSLAGEKATDKDRQALAESVIVSQADADTEVIVQDARIRFADHTAAVIAARLLDEEADRFASNGNGDASRAAADEAVEQRALARRVLEGGNAPVLISEYVDDGDGSAAPAFDEGRFREDVERIAADANRVDPEETEADAQELRDKAQRLDAFLIPMVGAIVILTFAQINKSKSVRLGLTAAGTAVWIVATVLAFGGG